VQYTLLGLGWEYETLVTAFIHVPMQLTFDDLHHCLLLQEHCLKAFREGDESSVSHRLLRPPPMDRPHPRTPILNALLMVNIIIVVKAIGATIIEETTTTAMAGVDVSGTIILRTRLL